MDINSLAHTKWNCKYHIVFAPKYRRKVAYGKMKQDIANILSMLCKTPVYNFINDRLVDEVYQSVFFRCIMFLSCRVTFLCNVLCQIHYTSGNPVRYFFMKKL